MDTKGRLTAIVGNELYEACLSRLHRCIANALSHVHQQHIKPRSVLLTQSGLRITDFGASTDFSVSEDGDRERQNTVHPGCVWHQPNRRSADIFSLGTMFLEITYALAEISLEDLRSLRPEHDRSFQAKIGHINLWFSPLNQLPRAHEWRLAF